MKISQISEVFSGTYQKKEPNGQVLYLHRNDFDEQGAFKSSNPLAPALRKQKKLEKHLLADQDILLSAKGDNHIACFYHTSMGPAVASSTFLVIRVQNNLLIPAFLQWYLNTSPTQRILDSLAKGSRMPSLSKKSLLELDVPVPSLDQQKLMLHMHKLWKQEKALYLELIQQKEIFYQTALLKQAQPS
jgi:restriction endonuclease S subunit